MTLSNSIDDYKAAKTDIFDDSNWDSLYCSHLWKNSQLRKTILTAPYPDNRIVNYCYTCRGKIRKYEVRSSDEGFVPKNHSTPTRNVETTKHELPLSISQESSLNVISVDISDRAASKGIETAANIETNHCIPTISRQIDSSFRQKFTSYDMRPNEINQRRLRKSLKGIGCIVNLALNDNSVKKRTHIQACSISVMILAIIIISFVLVNFTSPNFTRASNVASTIVVPTKILEPNETLSEINSKTTAIITTTLSSKEEDMTLTEETQSTTTENASLIFRVISKIRKNVRTFPKDTKKESLKPKEIINRDVSQRFCSCQTDEVCMLDENSGTSICRKATDIEDPTGCGGLCAMDTEACQLVDRLRGVRVCRLLSLVTCSSEEWRCRNGLCVKADQRCDGFIQCYDRSDEMHCECDLTKQFRCGHSISCFSNTKLCDGIIDCWDGFDELNCTTECPGDQFTCTNGQCIISSRFCDNLADCADGSDEPHGCDGGCSAQELRCANNRCVPKSAQCDGRDHCGDATDELNCSQN